MFAKHSFTSVLHLRLASVKKTLSNHFFSDCSQLALTVQLFTTWFRFSGTSITCISGKINDLNVLQILHQRRCKIWVAPGRGRILVFFFCKNSKLDLFLQLRLVSNIRSKCRTLGLLFLLGFLIFVRVSMYCNAYDTGEISWTVLSWNFLNFFVLNQKASNFQCH